MYMYIRALRGSWRKQVSKRRTTSSTQDTSSDIPKMMGIPIIVTPPDCRPSPGKNNQQQSDKRLERLTNGTGVTVPELHNPSSAHGPKKWTTSMMSGETQTASTDDDSGHHSPTHPHTNTTLPAPPFAARTEHIHNIHDAVSGSHLTCNLPTVKSELTGGFLAPPETDVPPRPMTPQADLYDGQTSAAFGMTFAKPVTHWRKSYRPATCPNSFEDHKHRMLIDWLDRRGSA